MNEPESFELKPIHRDAVPEAIEKAERYRLLNDPEQAESICRDVLRADPGNQEALIVLILSITDQFVSGGWGGPARAREFVGRLNDEYQRLYYNGIISEREGRALLSRSMSSGFAYDAIRTAMDWYEKAEKIRPAGIDDAILRWNSCVRTIRRAKLCPMEEGRELPLE